MSRDNIFMIPYLSKELNLIGFPTLPYRLERTFKKSNSKGTEESLNVTFKSRRMISALTSVCCELVQRVKTIGEDDSNSTDKFNFEISKLQNQLKLSKSLTENLTSDLDRARKANQQLQEKIDHLQRTIKDYKAEEHKLTKRNQTNEDVLKHALKKKESDLFELHNIIWKKFNLMNKNYFPENFELIQLNQPDFSKLWSTVKYSDPKTGEEALKKAVNLFQKNNKALMEENFLLKNCFLVVMKELNEVLKLMVDKLNVPSSVLINFKVNEIFENVEILNISVCTNFLQKFFEILRKVCEFFDEASFIVCDDLFVCWSSIVKNLENCTFLKENQD